MTASPKLNPGSPGIGNSGTKLFEKSKHEEPFGVSRVRNHAGKRWTLVYQFPVSFQRSASPRGQGLRRLMAG